MNEQWNRSYAYEYLPERLDGDDECDESRQAQARTESTRSTPNSSNSALNTNLASTNGTLDDTSSEDEEDLYVSARDRATKNTGGPASIMAAALATTAAVRIAGALLDEDDLFATVGAMANAFGTGGAGGGGGGAVAGGGAGVASMPAAQAAALQQMAVGATQSATTSVASGTAAAGGAGAGAGAGGIIGAAANNSGSGAAAATVVTAVAAGIYATGLNGQPLVCPNITNPDILPGSVSFDFWGVQERPNETESLVMATSFIERYEDIFGCDSVFARSMINCSLPCTVEPTGNFTSTTRCCEEIDDPAFGDVVRCTFDCFVHCVGCPFEEPLFLEPESISGQRQLEENILYEDCSPLCLIGQELESLICAEAIDDCRVIRGSLYTHANRIIGSANETSNATVVEVFSEEADTLSTSIFVPFPSAIPSLAPSSIPSTSPSLLPSSAPSLLPSVDPTSRPSMAPSSIPSFTPSQLPSSDPSGLPTLVPSASPSFPPSSSPTSFFLEATFFDEFGFSYGPVDGAVLSASNVGPSLTIRVDVPFNVQAVAFFFDWDKVFEDHHRPFFIFSENEDGFGTTFPPLYIVGLHAVMFIAYGEDLREVGARTVYFQMVE